MEPFGWIVLAAVVLGTWNAYQRLGRGRGRGWADRSLACRPANPCRYCANPVLATHGGHKGVVRDILVSVPALVLVLGCGALLTVVPERADPHWAAALGDVLLVLGFFGGLVASLLYLMFPLPVPRFVRPRWVREERIVERLPRNIYE